jgi:hypothetical protein
MFGLFKAVEGDHTYTLAPLAVSVVEVPLQRVALPGEILTVGVGFTVTVATAAGPVHPAEEDVTE